jgi:Fic family protein
VFEALLEAKAAVFALTETPFQRDWVEKLQQAQLKMEVAGTSRIEGADFTENELEQALLPQLPLSDFITRSQRQAHAAMQTYRWIAELEADKPVDEYLVCEVHRRVVANCDDDHCEPGKLRTGGHNVTFGYPRHRGCEGGQECSVAFAKLIEAVNTEFRGHDLLIRALAFHYHIAAMHPFGDGNGRTARAMEALFLQRAGLRDAVFVPMSNYYYEEKPRYLEVLGDVRRENHDLTPFLLFGLKGIAVQCKRLFNEIRRNMQKALFRNTMFDLFNRLESGRKRVIKERQLEILKLLLEEEKLEWTELQRRMRSTYEGLKNGRKAVIRDILSLEDLGAVTMNRLDNGRFEFAINLQWPSQITETEFFKRIKEMPKAKSHAFLS